MNIPRKLHVVFAGHIAGMAGSVSGQAISLDGPSTSWTSLGANYDYPSDQQTGDPASDIVGTGSDPGFFTTFDYGGSSPTDGNLGFRVRLDDHGGTTAAPSFDRNLWIGIDADLSGDIDVFLGVNRQGSSNELGIYSPGSGLNISPTTTTIESTPFASYVIAPGNFNYRLVNFVSDGGTTNDLTTSSSGDPDWYASFLIPFNDVVTYLGGLSSPIIIDDTTAMRYIVATSTQVNSLNQDIGGLDGGTKSTTPFVESGSFTPPIDAGGNPVPEPRSLALLLLGLPLLFRRRR